MKYAIKILILTTLLLLSNTISAQQVVETEISVGEITNEIRLGRFAGNRNLAMGVRNIVEEILIDKGYDLWDGSELKINIRLVFFDIKNMGTSIAVFRKGVALTQIAAIGQLYKGDELIKVSKQRGASKQISQSTLIIANDGTFNQQTASIALKKVCIKIIEDLLR